jgi:dipeptidyl aminopeptidase/acylaminoacyl peptidase
MRSRAVAWFLLLAACLLLGTADRARAGGAGKGAESERRAAGTVRIERWLQLGPAVHPEPVLPDGPSGGGGADGETAKGAKGAKGGDGDGEGPELESSLGREPSGAWPRPWKGRELAWFDGGSLRWSEVETEKGRLRLEPPEPDLPAVALLAAYVTVDRWAAVDLALEGPQVQCAWIDGTRTIDCRRGGEPQRAEVELTPGTHLLWVETAFDPRHDDPWTLAGSLLPTERTPDVAITSSTSPVRAIDILDVLDAPDVTALAMSPDGAHVALILQRYVPGTSDAETWIELRETQGGRLVEARREPKASGIAWSMDGRYLSWITTTDEASTLWLDDRTTGRTFPLLDGVKKLGSYRWSPGGRVIAYAVADEAAEDERGVKQVEGLIERSPGSRDNNQLHLVTVPDGVTRRLTQGETKVELQDLSRDGRRLLFSRQLDDYTRRPYSRVELWEVELASFTSKKLRDFRWLSQARYSPDGPQLLLMSQPNEFGANGGEQPEAPIPNSYDQQLYLWEPGSDRAECITRDFRPAVHRVEWSLHDGNIYLSGYDGSNRRLFRYDWDSRVFVAIDSGFEVIDDLALSAHAPFLAAVGSSPWMPEWLALVDLRGYSTRRLQHPGDAWYADVRRGGFEPWSFEAASGRRIEGHVYLPPDFDPARRWPAIVFYYGGVTPTERSFGGRYPKEWWASNGYVVYVPQPSGAIGYGREFSAAHVNDWGKVTAEEIIEGTERFLDAHPFVDRERVGCIGASYGGFMTMLLTTKTDLFAAAVAHAGISSIASYWGEGAWGYAYNSVSAADSFPWNRPDIYVEQSPLFRADRVRTPILLTHGREDTNVPVGESDAFFVALELLGKEVAYVQVEGQDHWILDHDKRAIWSRTILAWFDRWLRDRPAWWNDLYGE